MGLVQARRVRVIILVLQLFLHFPLLLGRLPGVLGLLTHARSPSGVGTVLSFRFAQIGRSETEESAHQPHQHHQLVAMCLRKVIADAISVRLTDISLSLCDAWEY